MNRDRTVFGLDLHGRITVKGVILAGGFATRLRPLSCSKPKLLFPIVGVPLIDFMIPWLKTGGVTETILAVNHLLEKLKLGVGGKRLGSKVTLSAEKEPLGTGGPLWLARRKLGKSEPFVVVNGDIVSNIDLEGMVKVHGDRSAAATVALVSVYDPRQFGSVTVSVRGQVSRFEEKKKARTGPGLVNAGVYVLSPDVLDYIPSGGPCSLERDVFPRLAAEGRMWSWRHKGYWYDIGRTSEYLRANMELLAKKTMRRHTRYRRVGGSKIIRPVHLGNGSELGARTRIGPRCILSDRVRVDDESIINDSIVFEDSVIGKNSTIEGAVVGEKVMVGEGSSIGRGAIVAGQISIPEGSVLKAGSVVLF